MWNVVSHIEGSIQGENFREQEAEEDIWILEGGYNRRLEKLYRGASQFILLTIRHQDGQIKGDEMLRPCATQGGIK